MAGRLASKGEWKEMGLVPMILPGAWLQGLLGGLAVNDLCVRLQGLSYLALTTYIGVAFSYRYTLQQRLILFAP